MSISKEEFYWAVGIFEGEGSPTLTKAGKANPDTYDTRLTVVSTDLDILERFAAIVGCGKITPVKRSISGFGIKQQYHWRLNKQSEISDLLYRMFPLLGNRRKVQARKVLDYIERDRSKLPDERIVEWRG